MTSKIGTMSTSIMPLLATYHLERIKNLYIGEDLRSLFLLDIFIETLNLHMLHLAIQSLSLGWIQWPFPCVSREKLLEEREQKLNRKCPSVHSRTP